MILNFCKMIIKCIYNAHIDLRKCEYKALSMEEFGRFGTSTYGEYGGITKGQTYIVMGIIIFKTYQAYLIDDEGSIGIFPCQLFDIIDEKVNSNWSYRLINKNEDIYPFIQAIIGYPELCTDKKAYEKIIIEHEEEARRIYFRRKIELEKVIAEKKELDDLLNTKL